jgi:pilus assembly protein CpaB
MRRTRPRMSRVMLVLSAALAVLATMAVQARLRALEVRAAAGGPHRAVVAAATNLDRGTVLEEGMLEVVQMPVRYLPPGSIRDPGVASGRVLAGPVAAGEPLTEARLAPPGGPVAALVPPGLRAVPVPSALPSIAVVPGDLVEVHATYAAGQPYTETVVTGAEVLSVLASSSFGEEGAAPATLLILVGPEAAERLAHARAFADLSVALVSAEGSPVREEETEVPGPS